MNDDILNRQRDPTTVRAFFEKLGSSDYVVCHIYSADTRTMDPVSSKQLLHECRRWAATLAKVSGRIVPIVGRSTLSMIAAWLGAILAGKLPTFISYPSHKISAEDYTKKLSNYIASFSNKVFVGEVMDRDIATNMLTQEDLSDPTDANDVCDFLPSPDQPLFVQCSSGSTGLQKAVGVTTEQLESQLTSYGRALDLSADQDRIVSWLPLYHDMGLIATFLLPFMTRTPVVFIDTFEWAANPSLLLQCIAEARGTLCWLPNFAFSFLCKVPPQYDLSSMRSFINCSEPVSTGALRSFCSHHKVRPEQVSVSYALAENVFAATQSQIGNSPHVLYLELAAMQQHIVKPQLRERFDCKSIDDTTQPGVSGQTRSIPLVSCGRPIDGVEVRVDSSANDHVGEVLLRGSSCVNNYYQSPPPRPDGWFPTGDLGLLHDGELYLCGRNKDVIIQNGKNIYPQDLEQVVSHHPVVRSGRTVAIGSWEQELGSERVVVLLEAEDTESRLSKMEVCRELREQLSTFFNIHCDVHSVPRMWLKKTTSGKIARQANLAHFQMCRDREIHVLGDSHVRLFWSDFKSHQDLYRRVHTYWADVLHAGNLDQATPWVARIQQSLRPHDVFVFQAGEPECRTIFPGSPTPIARIDESVRAYREFFANLRAKFPNRIAYLTGPPTSPRNVRSNRQWPINGTPENRYELQTHFYGQMCEMCHQEGVIFLDVCSPLIGSDGYIDHRRFHDDAHLDPSHRELYLDLFDRAFGFVDGELATLGVTGACWDGSYSEYLRLIKEKIRQLCPDVAEPDFEQLVENGILDSLAIIELITILERDFRFMIPLHEIDRHSFNSVTEIYDRFAIKRKKTHESIRPLLNMGNDLLRRIKYKLRRSA